MIMLVTIMDHQPIITTVNKVGGGGGGGGGGRGGGRGGGAAFTRTWFL